MPSAQKVVDICYPFSINLSFPWKTKNLLFFIYIYLL